MIYALLSCNAKQTQDSTQAIMDNQKLIKAVVNNDTTFVVSALKQGVNVNITDAEVTNKEAPAAATVTATGSGKVGTFTVNGLIYTVLTDKTTVEVSGATSSGITSLNIPNKVKNEGVEYTVVKTLYHC